MKNARNQRSPGTKLSEEQADALLHQILDELELEHKAVSGRNKFRYRRIIVRRYVMKQASILMCLILIAFFLAPGTIIPASVTDVSAAEAENSSSLDFEFHVNTMFPVREITAQINEHSLEVVSRGNQIYQIRVEENGCLHLDIYSATGMHSSHDVDISGIDSYAPIILSHQLQDDVIAIYMSDGGGVGIDYQSVSACTEVSGNDVTPAYVDEEQGIIAYALPEETILITVPDQNGNYRVFSLMPVELP